MKVSHNFIWGICAIAISVIFMSCSETDIAANWTLISVTANDTTFSTGDESLTQPLTLFATPEGEATYRISGFSGINHFNGTLTMDGRTAQVGTLAGTMMMGTAEDAKLESTFLIALQNGGKVSAKEKDGETFLTITNKNYDSSLMFKKTILENTAWNLSMYNTNNAVTNIPEGIDGANLTFAPEGALYGSTGVNNIIASYTFTNDGDIVISTVGLTRMAAPNEEMATFEMRQVELLEQAATYQINGSTLTLQNADGETLLVYEK